MMLRRLLIRVCALVVPGALRPRWREEWLAELDASPVRPFDRRVFGAVRDALDARLSPSTNSTPKAALMSGLWFDIRSGIRQLQRHRGFTTLSVCVLALGIGINSALFSVVYTVFFKPWPIERPEEVAFVFRNQFNRTVWPASFSGVKRKEFIDSNPGIAALGAYWGIPRDIEVGGLTERTWGEWVTPNYFDVLGVRPVAGRTFTAEDIQSNPDAGVVISDALWHERFGRDPGAVGRTVRINKREVPIIGVVGPEFRGLTGVWTPSRWWTVGEQFSPRAGLSAFVRMKPKVTAEQAQLSANILGSRENEEMRKVRPQYALPPGVPKYLVEPANDVRLPQEFGSTVVPERIATALSVVVVMVLIIATINIAGLLLARAISRTSEIATRRALGVTPLRLTRQLLTETVLLTTAGGSLGLLLAWNLVNLFTTLTPDSFTIDAGFDVRVVAFAALVCLGTGLLIGLAPARHALKLDVLSALSGGYRDSGRHRDRLRQWVVVPQVALSLILLVVTGVHVRSLRQVENAPLGFERDQAVVLTLSRTTPEDEPFAKRRPDREIAEEYQALYRTLYNTITATPGLHAGLITALPTGSTSNPDIATSEMSHAAGRSDDLPIQRIDVSPGAFEALGMRVLDGRDFDARDTRQLRSVAIVSQSVARRLWPERRAVGQRIAALSPQQTNAKLDWYEVVGVVNDTSAVLAKPTDPARIYTTLGQGWQPWAWNLVVRGAGPDAITAMRSAVGGVDPFSSVTQVRPLKAYVDELLYPRRLAAAILGVSGCVGLGLACIGLYGVVSFSVARRLRELGIRATLGAQPGDLVRLVLSEGGRMAGIGSVIGLVGGIAALRYTAHLADGVPATDALVFIVVPLTIGAVILLACYLPARRAGRVDPVETLRE
ncbi:MAG: ADOP family duplicated permease [Acidobacteria bacterium]|nr:ADOP family duplicated permease [Acidobacteriota bacterium]